MHATTILETSLPFAWQRALDFVLKSPERIKFGGGKEVKHAFDSQVTFLLDQTAVNDALMGVVHPGDPFCTPAKLAAYKKEYTEDYPHQNHDYTYYARLREGFNHDQIALLRNGLLTQCEEGLSSNRNVAILYNPDIEGFSGKATPCWNEVLIRLLNRADVSIHITFRSHDLFTAWEGNMCSILEFLNRDVVKPCGCRIKWVQEVNYSLHIYEADIPAARAIPHLNGRSPQLWEKQLSYNRQEA